MHRRWKDIDMAVSLRFTGNLERARRVDRELERVGLDALPIWQFPSPVYTFLQTCLPGLDRGMAGNMGYFNSGFGHYRAWKTCRGLGARHCLVVEDDVRFPRDLDALERGLASLPADYDIAMLDKIKCAHASDEDIASFLASPASRICDGWIRPWGGCGPRSFAAYMLSEKGMDALIARFESSVSVRPKYKLRVVDGFVSHNWLHADVNICLAHPNLAIQCPAELQDGNASRGYGETSRYADIQDDLVRFYHAIGVNPEDYST